MIKNKKLFQVGSPNPTVYLNVVDLRLKRRLKIVNLEAPIQDVTA